MPKNANLLLTIFVIYSVVAAHSANVIVSPGLLYESQEKWFNLTIDNFGSEDTITSVALSAPGFEITEIKDFDGWSYEQDGNDIIWYDGTIETNVKQAIFQIKLKAPIVDENSTHDWNIQTNDTDGNSNNYTIPIELVNDGSGPILLNETPQNGSYIRMGSHNQYVSVIAYDPETGLKEASVRWNDCSGNETEQELICNDELCETIVDWSMYDDGEFICYTFKAYNNVEEFTEMNARVGVDGTPPSITLISPDNDTLLDDSTQFEFNASDNIASELYCEFFVDENLTGSMNVTNGVADLFQINISEVEEGYHDWYITCVDGANWSTTSDKRTFKHDKYPPSIQVEEIGIKYRGDLVEVGINVTDFSGVNTTTVYLVTPNNETINLTLVNGTVLYQTYMNSTLGIYTLVVEAFDNLGKSNLTSKDFELTYNYNITLVVDPNPVKQDKSVTVSGTVTYDNGSEVPEDSLILFTGENITLNITNSTFEYEYIPIAGTHNITATVTNYDNRTFLASETLVVEPKNNPKDSGSGSSGGGVSHSGGQYCGDGNCGFGESCSNCASDCGRCPEVPQPKVEPIVQLASGGQYCGDGTCGFSEDCNNCERDCGACIEEEIVKPEDDSIGTGRAVAWFSLDNAKVIMTWLLWFALLVGAVALVAWKRPAKGKKDLGWDSYFEKRR